MARAELEHGRDDVLTGLGEEGAESLIRIGCLALFGQISIRLGKITVRKPVETYLRRDDKPEYHARGSRARGERLLENSRIRRSSVHLAVHTSQQEFAIWQPAWPTVEDLLVSNQLVGRC